MSHEREDTRLVAPVGIILTIKGKQEVCVTRNLSRGGMFVITKTQVEPGTMIDVEVRQGPASLKTKAEVVNQSKEGLGLKFDEKDDEFKNAIRALMTNLAAAPEIDDELAAQASATKCSWSLVPDGKWWRPLRNRQRSVGISSISLDGASIKGSSRPPVGETIVFYLEGPIIEAEGVVTCEAHVVRHTKRGFAIRFNSPSVAFRRAISKLRRTKWRPAV